MSNVASVPSSPPAPRAAVLRAATSHPPSPPAGRARRGRALGPGDAHSPPPTAHPAPTSPAQLPTSRVGLCFLLLAPPQLEKEEGSEMLTLAATFKGKPAE